MVKRYIKKSTAINILIRRGMIHEGHRTSSVAPAWSVAHLQHAGRAGAAAATFPYLRTRARYMIGYCIESILFFFQAVSIIFIFSFLF